MGREATQTMQLNSQNQQSEMVGTVSDRRMHLTCTSVRARTCVAAHRLHHALAHNSERAHCARAATARASTCGGRAG